MHSSRSNALLFWRLRNAGWRFRTRLKKSARSTAKTLKRRASPFARTLRSAKRRFEALEFSEPPYWDQRVDGSSRPHWLRALGGTEHIRPHVAHVSFGTKNFGQALVRLRHSARRFGIRDVRLYGADHPAVRHAAEENPEIMCKPRGAGYWLWKPYIILDAMDRVEPGTVLIYTDAGQRYIADPSPLVALAMKQDIVLFHHINFRQSDWTKRDCFVLMGADAPEYWDARQLDASIQIYRAGAKARNFLLELQSAMRDPHVLSDQLNTCGLPNLEGFRDHRHDQSILTILAIKHRVQSFPTPKFVWSGELSEASNQAKLRDSRDQRLIVFEHHRRRNEPARVYWRRRLREFFRRV